MRTRPAPFNFRRLCRQPTSIRRSPARSLISRTPEGFLSALPLRVAARRVVDAWSSSADVLFWLGSASFLLLWRDRFVWCGRSFCKKCLGRGAGALLGGAGARGGRRCEGRAQGALSRPTKDTPESDWWARGESKAGPGKFEAHLRKAQPAARRA